MRKHTKTICYYDDHAEEFINGTKSVDFRVIQDLFLDHLSSGTAILDLGCGSGRDTKYFLEQGYKVTAADGSERLCREASKYTGIPVCQMLFEELEDVNIYDGIWACASILHLPKEELSEVFSRIYRAVKLNGVIYTSFKYGSYEGERNGRYFTDFTEKTFEEFLKGFSGLRSEKVWITCDVRPGREEEKWLNILLRKVDIR